MPKRKKKSVNVPKTTASADRLIRVLTKRKKAELIEIIVEIARADRGIMLQLEMEYGVEAPPKELVAETRQAIDDATDFIAHFGLIASLVHQLQRHLHCLGQVPQLD